jgi:hypothetical protein
MAGGLTQYPKTTTTTALNPIIQGIKFFIEDEEISDLK